MSQPILDGATRRWNEHAHPFQWTAKSFDKVRAAPEPRVRVTEHSYGDLYLPFLGEPQVDSQVFHAKVNLARCEWRK